MMQQHGSISFLGICLTLFWPLGRVKGYHPSSLPPVPPSSGRSSSSSAHLPSSFKLQQERSEQKIKKYCTNV